jgi:alcohol dehydrogenase, propanol-preferring
MSSLGIPSEMLAVEVVEIPSSPSSILIMLYFNKPYKVHKIPTPKSLRPNEILLKTAIASLCHTDLMVTAGKFPT